MIESSPTPFQPELGQYDSPFDVFPTVGVTQRMDEHGIPLEVSIEATPTSSSPTVPILNLSVDINPLTGMPPSNPVLLERRPMAIKVTNYPRYVRPQSGLTLADQVFEYYIEDQLTRFIAIFYGNDAELVGPVRSGRFFDEHVALMYQSFLVFKYADKREYDYLKASSIADYLVVPSDGACPPFRVGKQERDTYNNIFFNTSGLAKCIANKGIDNSRPALRSGFFSELIPNSEYSVERIATKYSADDYHYWQFDPSTLKYFRFQETVSLRGGAVEAYAPLTDVVTGLQVSAENIVVLFVPHVFANQFDAEDEVYHINLIDSGLAYVFRDGIAIPARWRRSETGQPLFLTTSVGSPIFLRPGVTFYEVVGASSGSYQDDDGWHFEFLTP